VTILKPQAGPQTKILQSTADIIIGGGAAGLGKTYALLLSAVRHIDNGHYRAVIFRKHRPQLTTAGGLVDAAKKLYIPLGARLKMTTLEFIFPSGAIIQFSSAHDRTEAMKFDGAEIPLVCFDELIHFEEEVFWYLLSRNRNTAGLKNQMICTTNPSPSSWLKGFISWWIDEDTGFPIQERACAKRYMVRQAGEIHWFDSKTEADEYALSVTPESMLKEKTQIESKSVTFIPGSISDNKILLSQSPEYASSLYALPAKERQRLLLGSWNAVDGDGMYFRPEWFELVRAAPAGGMSVRFWDRASTEGSGDYTVGVKMTRTVDGFFYIEDVVRVQKSPKGVEDAIVNTATQDGSLVTIGLELQPGSAGQAEKTYLAKALIGKKFKFVPASTNKVKRAEPFSAQVEAGNVKLVQGAWNQLFLDELNNFTGQSSEYHDDQVDAASGAFNMLSLKKPLPKLSFSDMSQRSKWK